MTAALEAAENEATLGTDVAGTLDWCVDVGRRAPVVGEGETKRLWELLAAVAMRNVSAARMLEPHLDALSILRQSGTDLFRSRIRGDSSGSTRARIPRGVCSRLNPATRVSRRAARTEGGSCGAPSRGAHSLAMSRTLWSRPSSTSRVDSCSRSTCAGRACIRTRTSGSHAACRT